MQANDELNTENQIRSIELYSSKVYLIYTGKQLPTVMKWIDTMRAE